MGENAGWDKLICGCYCWCYDICINRYWKSFYSTHFGNWVWFLWIVWLNGSCGCISLNDFDVIKWFYLWPLSCVKEIGYIFLNGFSCVPPVSLWMYYHMFHNACICVRIFSVGLSN